MEKIVGKIGNNIVEVSPQSYVEEINAIDTNKDSKRQLAVQKLIEIKDTRTNKQTLTLEDLDDKLNIILDALGIKW